MTSFNLVKHFQTGEQRDILANYYYLSYALAINTPGTMTVRFVDEDYSESDFGLDDRYELWRKPTGASGFYRVGDTAWFLRKAVKFIDPIANKSNWEIRLESALGLLNRRIVFYRRGTLWADKLIADGNDGPADDLMKEYMREAFTSPVVDGTGVPDTDRVVSGTLFSVAADTSEAPVVEKQAAFRTLLSTVSELASNSAELGTNLFYDVISREKILEFTTWSGSRGNNRTEFAVFSPEFSNITNVTLTWDYTKERNVALVGGDEGATARIMSEVINTDRSTLTPWNRNEMFVDARNIGTVPVLQDVGREALGLTTPVINVSAKPIDRPRSTYGIDYFFGDLVRVIVDGTQFDCTVENVKMTVDKGVEKIDITLKGENSL